MRKMSKLVLLLLAVSSVSFAQPPWVTGQQANTGAQQSTAPSPYFAQRLQQRTAALNSGTATPLQGLQKIQNQIDARRGQQTGQAVGHLSAKKLRDQAFTNMVSTSLPMSPQQIIQLHKLFNATQRAASTVPGIPPRPVSRAMLVNLSPGATPPVIRLAAGYISTLVFLDSTGAPWPIQAYDLGNPKAYNIQWNQKNNMLMIQAQTLSTMGNLMVKLRDEPTPLTISLIPDQQAVDYRVDLRVPGLGPQAKALPQGNGLPSSASPLLLNILNGLAPVGSKVLKVTGADCQAWLIQHKLYLRTRYKVISPGWLSMMTSADGTNAYELNRTPTVLLTGNGKLLSINVSGF